VQTDEFCTGDPLFTVTRALTVISWNRAAERLTGDQDLAALVAYLKTLQ